MTVATSAVFELITALIAKMQVNATLTAANVLVIDGPLLTDASRPNIVFVGAQPSDENGQTPDATFAQRWGELGARARYEDLTVACELWVRDGSTDLAARRSTAQSLLAAIEADLRTAFTLSVGRVQWCQLESGQLVQQQTQQGGTVALPFMISARARLASQ